MLGVDINKILEPFIKVTEETATKLDEVVEILKEIRDILAERE